MRLITHNMLQCNVKNCQTNNYPLRFEGVELEQVESEPNFEFIKSMLDRIDYNALVTTAFQLGIPGLPEAFPAELDEQFLNNLHNVLLQTQVKNGNMICNNCNHIYPIKDGIANMLLAEHEL